MASRTTILLSFIVSLLCMFAVIYTLLYFNYLKSNTVYRWFIKPMYTPAYKDGIFTLRNLSFQNSTMALYGLLQDPSGGSLNSSNTIVIEVDEAAIRNMIKSKIHKVSKSDRFFPYPDRFVSDIDCPALFRGDDYEIFTAEVVMRAGYPPIDVVSSSRHCLGLKLRHGYIMESFSKEESDFPIAFSITMSTPANQVENLLRAIYRPQNVYCISTDGAGDRDIHGMILLATCFDNVFVVSPKNETETGSYLNSHLTCMSELWNISEWNYLVTLTSQDFPLKTNMELVSALKELGGTNDIPISSDWSDTSDNMTSPPHDITPVMGGQHVMISRDFVDYVLHNDTATNVLSWIRESGLDDRTYLATLNYNPVLEAPGGGGDQSNMTNEHRSSVCFEIEQGSTNLNCSGKFDDGVCVFGVLDLGMITNQPHIFASKFRWDYQRLVLQCLDERYYNMTASEYFNTHWPN